VGVTSDVEDRLEWHSFGRFERYLKTGSGLAFATLRREADGYATSFRACRASTSLINVW
jgi:predicted GIY-YIG superfamily endonuclease